MNRVKSYGRYLAGLPAKEEEAPLLEEGDANSDMADAENMVSFTTDEERAMLQRRFQLPNWRLDRGAGYYATERSRNKRPCLVQTGRHAGRSRVKVTGISAFQVMEHKLKRDFFNSAVNAPLHTILGALVFIYFSSLIFWSLAYYVMWSVDDTCFTGFDGLVSAFLFAVETQQTIGYGTRAPGECWITFVLVAVHSLLTVVMDSLILGITFARISHPKNRGRTILISDCATIARRDGELKFMFRVADIQRRPVTNPVVRALLFTWGPARTGRVTAEGEHVPVSVQAMPLTGSDPTLLLPVTLEHIIDERSPLAGQTQKSLEAVCAEVVILFSATTELGDNFTVRQSYLPSEIHWGHVFVPIIHPAPEGETQHYVNIARFHDVEPQPGLDLVPPHRLAAKVMSGGDRGALPAPQRATNTLVLSETGVVGAREGRHMLMFRVGDTYPGGQVLDVHVTAFLYRWQARSTPEGEVLPFTVQPLHVTPARPCLRYPAVVTHCLDTPGSPVAAWSSAAAKRLDSDAEVLVMAQGVCAHTGLPITRQRVYPVLAGIRWGAMFLPMLTPPPPGVPASRARGGAAVNWVAFHATAPAQMDVMPAGTLPVPLSRPISRTPSWNLHSQPGSQAILSPTGPSQASASHTSQGGAAGGGGGGSQTGGGSGFSAAAVATRAIHHPAHVNTHASSHSAPPHHPASHLSATLAGDEAGTGTGAGTTAPAATQPVSLPELPQGSSPTAFEAHSLSTWNTSDISGLRSAAREAGVAAASAAASAAAANPAPSRPPLTSGPRGGGAGGEPSRPHIDHDLSFADMAAPLPGTHSLPPDALAAAAAALGAARQQQQQPFTQQSSGPMPGGSGARARQQQAGSKLAGAVAGAGGGAGPAAPPAAQQGSPPQSQILVGQFNMPMARPYAPGWAGRSTDNTMSRASEGQGSDTTGSDTTLRHGNDWRQTRSLFTAMEEMAKLAAEEAEKARQQGQS